MVGHEQVCSDSIVWLRHIEQAGKRETETAWEERGGGENASTILRVKVGSQSKRAL